MNKRISAQEALKHPWIINQSNIDKIDQKTASKAFNNLKSFKVSYYY